MDRPYTTKELIEAIEQVWEWFQNGYEVPEEIAHKMGIALRWINSKSVENVKPLSPDDYAALPLDHKDAIDWQVKDLINHVRKPFQFKRIYTSYVIQMYNFGIADALGGVPVDEGACLIVDKDTTYETACPHCGKQIVLDLREQAKDSYGIKV